MNCAHELSFREILRLEGQLSLSKAVTYDCPRCGQNCELELKSELKALAMAVALLLFVIAAAALFSAFGGIHPLVNLLMAVFCAAVLAGSYAGMLYLYYRLGKFGFSAVEYHSIIAGRRPGKR